MYNNTFMVEGTFASKDSVFCALNMHIEETPNEKVVNMSKLAKPYFRKWADP